MKFAGLDRGHVGPRNSYLPREQVCGRRPPDTHTPHQIKIGRYKLQVKRPRLAGCALGSKAKFFMANTNATALAALLSSSGAADFSLVNVLYVVPGGGPGNAGDAFPMWTRERTQAAVSHWRTELRCKPRRASAPSCAFLALSCGSLNAPSARMDDGRALFESMATVRFLEESGVPSRQIIADSFSWDTVTNALALRWVVEALSGLHAARFGRHEKERIELRVFISDFHAARFAANAQWALGVAPSVLDNSMLSVHSVPSSAFSTDAAARAARMAHEERGAAVARANARIVRTINELQAFVLLGGHGGLWSYTHRRHAAAKGGGW